MIVFYPDIRVVHIGAVSASGLLFALRGFGVLAGAQWPLSAPWRYLSYAIDSILLTAALMLLTILPGAVFANGWLLVKLGLLVAYVVLGSLALKRARARRNRVAAFVAALSVFAFMVGVARAHHPLGAFHAWLS